MTKVTRNCLVCNHGGDTTESKEEYKEISVCPKCNGAFVDLYHIHKYMKDDWEPNKKIQKEIDAKLARDAFDSLRYALQYGIDFASGKDKTSLLVIELDDIDSVPRVFYKGEEIEKKIQVSFDYKTRTSNPFEGGNEIHIEHFTGKRPDTITIKHNPIKDE